MNKFFALIALVVGLVSLPGKVYSMPTLPNVEFRLNHGDMVGPGVLLGSQVITNKEQLLKCRYDFSMQGGSSAAAINLKNVVDGTNCELPSGAIITDGLIDIITAPVGNSSTIAFGSGQAANDLKTATATASLTGLVTLIPVGTAATAIKMTAIRKPTITIATAALTVGKFNVFIKYLLGN